MPKVVDNLANKHGGHITDKSTRKSEKDNDEMKRNQGAIYEERTTLSYCSAVAVVYKTVVRAASGLRVVFGRGRAVVTLSSALVFITTSSKG